jgi:hypothetical protein
LSWCECFQTFYSKLTESFGLKYCVLKHLEYVWIQLNNDIQSWF